MLTFCRRIILPCRGYKERVRGEVLNELNYLKKQFVESGLFRSKETRRELLLADPIIDLCAIALSLVCSNAETAQEFRLCARQL